MRLLEVEITNICQHRHQKIEFNRGLVAVVGPNGAGKTNLMTSVYAGITGDFSRFDQSRQGIVSKFANPGEESSIRVVMEHNGVQAEIKRTLRPNTTRSLVIGDEDPITADKEITARIEDWFKMPIKVIGQYVFVNQWKMFSLLEETPSKKAEDLYRLFNIDKAEKCYDAVNAKILELDRTSANKFDVESIRARVITARNQLRDLESRLKKSQQASVTPMQEKQFNGVINDYNKYMSLKSQRENLLSCIVAYNVQLKEADKTVTVLGRDVDTYKERLTSIDKQIDNSKSDAKQWDDYNKAESARAHLLLELDKFDQSMAKTRAAQCTYEKHYEPAQYSEIEDLKSGYLQEINSLERLKANFESGENTECPTCGTAVDEFKDRMTRIAELPILKRKLALADTMLRSSRNYEKFHLDQANCLKEMSQKKAYLQQAIAAVPQVEQPSTEIVDVDKLHNDKKLMLARLFDLTNKLNERIKARNTLEGQLSAAELQIEDIETQLAVFKCPSKEQVEEARLKLVAIPITRAEQSQLVAEIAVIKRGIYDDENLLEEASDDIKKQERLNKWKDTLIAVKDILHRDALPKMVAQSYMNKLESQINKSLEELNIDFRVKSKEDLKFDAIFDDGVREVPVEVLSGGEKVVFSLAWRLAVNAEFANDIGILCLDEPTAGLDRDRLGCLRLAIEQMKLMSRKTGLQCIVITHAEDLMSLFDQVIEFTSPSKL